VAEGDLLIGADGLRSRTRTIIDPRAPDPRHVGLLNAGGFARADVPGETGTAYFIFGQRCFFGYLIHPSGEVWWFANPPSRKEPTREELAAVTQAEWRSQLMHLFKYDSGPMRRIIAATDKIMAGWNTYDFPTVPKWFNDRMVIVGDAAHATSPSSGQGASIAIEDAVVLAKCLRDKPNIGSAFAAYERLRRERVERVGGSGQTERLRQGSWAARRLRSRPHDARHHAQGCPQGHALVDVRLPRLVARARFGSGVNRLPTTRRNMRALRRIEARPHANACSGLQLDLETSTWFRVHRMDLEFSGELWHWVGPAPHCFVTVPEEQCDFLKAASKFVSYG
jgi:2-polyprenyl-6-methoxyphenol hydroxylase-like FAD-dependent oxidoreductase